jgi:hypothetical protein
MKQSRAWTAVRIQTLKLALVAPGGRVRSGQPAKLVVKERAEPRDSSQGDVGVGVAEVVLAVELFPLPSHPCLQPRRVPQPVSTLNVGYEPILRSTSTRGGPMESLHRLERGNGT